MAPDVRASAHIDGVRVVALEAFADARGRFLETWRADWLPGAPPMVQSNRSDSTAGVLRGLHYHLRQADYWTVTRGRVFVGLYDLRRRAATRGARETLVLEEGAERGLYIPRGVAHGFWALEDCTMTYLVDAYYDGGRDENGVAWNDPQAAIPWPGQAPLLSARDAANPLLGEIREETLPE